MEFEEVFKHAQRMCKYMGFDCDKCPIRNHVGVCQLRPWGGNDNIGESERQVMEWAKEHPEPQYPTWGEFLQMTYHDRNYASIFITPIPADIAEKLGLRPKEANGDG